MNIYTIEFKNTVFLLPHWQIYMTIKKKWFQSWFDTSYYHILYKHRNDKEAQKFINNLVQYLDIGSDQDILDLACGKGRHSVFLNQLGFKVTGVDLSRKNILQARVNSNARLNFKIHDMRTPMESQFDLILNLFTSFGYFENQEEDVKVLTSIRDGLNSQGVAVIDFMNIHNVLERLVLEEKIYLDGIDFDIHRFYDGNFIRKSIKVTDTKKDYDFEECVRAYSLEDFKTLLSANGLELLEYFGSYGLEAFDKKLSSRLILIFKKAAEFY